MRSVLSVLVVVLLALGAQAVDRVCEVGGDPHFAPLGGHRFDDYSTGWHLLWGLNGASVRVNQQLGMWGPRTAIVGFVAKYGNEKFEIDIDRTTCKVTVNTNRDEDIKKVSGKADDTMGILKIGPHLELKYDSYCWKPQKAVAFGIWLKETNTKNEPGHGFCFQFHQSPLPVSAIDCKSDAKEKAVTACHPFREARAIYYSCLTDICASPESARGVVANLKEKHPWHADKNVARTGTATQSSCNTGCWGGVPARGIDGNVDGNWGAGSCTHTDRRAQSWWSVDLKAPYKVSRVVVWNRSDCCSANLDDFDIILTYGGKIQATKNVKKAQRENEAMFHKYADRVTIRLRGTNYLHLAEVQVYGERTDGPEVRNVAVLGTATQSSVAYGGVPSRAIDGNTDGNWGSQSVTHTNQETKPWWEVDLGETYRVNAVLVWDRLDCCRGRLAKFSVGLFDGKELVSKKDIANWEDVHMVFFGGKKGDRVAVAIDGAGILSLAEVQVFATKRSPFTEHEPDPWHEWGKSTCEQVGKYKKCRRCHKTKKICQTFWDPKKPDGENGDNGDGGNGDNGQQGGNGGGHKSRGACKDACRSYKNKCNEAADCGQKINGKDYSGVCDRRHKKCTERCDKTWDCRNDCEKDGAGCNKLADCAAPVAGGKNKKANKDDDDDKKDDKKKGDKDDDDK